jgi:hypothetical protein
VPPSLNRGSPHPTARVFSSGRFGHGLPPSPSLAIITSPGCPGLRSRPLARLCYLFYRHSSTVRKQGRNSVVSYLTPITGLPPAVSPGRRSLSPYLHPHGVHYHSSILDLANSLFRVRAFPGERSTGSKGSILRYSGRTPSRMLSADTSVRSKDAVPKSGSNHHG